MKTRRLNFKELVAENKENLLRDEKALEQIEKRIEEKAIQNEAKLVRS